MNGERTKPLSIRVGFYVEQRQTGEKTTGRWRNWSLEAFSFRVEARHGPLGVRSSPLGLRTICQESSCNRIKVVDRQTTTTHHKKVVAGT